VVGDLAHAGAPLEPREGGRKHQLAFEDRREQRLLRLVAIEDDALGDARALGDLAGGGVEAALQKYVTRGVEERLLRQGRGSAAGLHSRVPTRLLRCPARASSWKRRQSRLPVG